MSATPAQHPDLKAEQEYIDWAYLCLEEMVADAEGLGGGGGAPKVGKALDDLKSRRLETLADAAEAICIGRMDLRTEEALYIGRASILDDQGGVVVVNWRAPAAVPFYETTPEQPGEVDRKRRFQIEDKRLLSISEEVFNRERFDDFEPIMDALLQELGRKRASEMRDIVATIQADQYRLMRYPLGGALVVQGGPGTGKTSVALHRAAWLLFNHEQLRRTGVLVVGPDTTFMRYVSQVLPSVGEAAVNQVAVGNLLEGVRSALDDDYPTRRLKGDPRMADLVRRALERRVRPPREPFSLRLDDAQFTLTPSHIESVIRQTQQRQRRYAEARTQFRDALGRTFYEAYLSVADPQRARGSTGFQQWLRGQRGYQLLIDRIWPSTSARELLHDLLEGPQIMAEVGKGLLSAEEQQQLLRDSVERLEDVRWTASDVPLLDEAEALLRGAVSRYGHVIVDEAQDLTPMQLRMVSRRAVEGSLTLVGDIAQSTGSWLYADWDEVTQHLVGSPEVNVEELTRGYRVSQQVMEYASRLLPAIAPGLTAPVAYRPGAGEPEIVGVSAGSLLKRLVDLLTAVGAGEGTVGVVVPDGSLRQVSAALDGAGIEFGEAVNGLSQPIELLTPRAVKGLEFDDVIVLEPLALVEEGDHGLRDLYVALTRATQQLYVLHSRGLPVPLQTDLPSESPPTLPSEREQEQAHADRTQHPHRVLMSSRISEAFGLARVLAADDTDRDLSQRLYAAALTIQDGGTEGEVIAALLLPGVGTIPTGMSLGADADQIIAACRDVQGDASALQGPADGALRVLLADALATARGLDGQPRARREQDETLIEMAKVSGIRTRLLFALESTARERYPAENDQ